MFLGGILSRLLPFASLASRAAQLRVNVSLCLAVCIRIFGAG